MEISGIIKNSFNDTEKSFKQNLKKEYLNNYLLEVHCLNKTNVN